MYCKQCDQEITFDEDRVSKNGKKIPLDLETDEPHNCPEREPYTIKCKGCKQEIFFDDDILSDSGKKIPQDHNGNHRCTARATSIKCRKCGEEITFDSKITSDSGIMIPQNPHGNNHQCSNRSQWR